MFKNILISIIIMACSILITCSCSNTKFLSGDQLLYTGKNEVILCDSGKLNDKRIKPLVESVTFYKPNNSIGGKRVLLPIGLWTYNYRKPAENKKPGWFYRTMAKEPVLVNNVNPEVRSSKLESELFGIGYFHAKVWATIDTSVRNPHKAGITYYVKPGKDFRYNEISFVKPEDVVDSIISTYEKDLSIRTNEVFDLEKIKEETKKITSLVAENGYFFFNQNNIKYAADTTRVPYRIDLRIGKTYDLPGRAIKKYFIGDIIIKILSESDTTNRGLKTDTISYKGLKIISSDLQFKPDIFSRAVYFRRGDAYSATKHRQTIAHLNSYGVFKFINLRYLTYPDTTVNKLDILIELTPSKDISLDLEGNLVTKSTGFSGPGLVATLAQGNLGGAANRLQLKLTGGFEWQWSGGSTSGLGTFSYNAGISSSIIFPRMITPFNLFSTQRFNLPKTTLTLGFELLNKVQYYRMSSVNLSYGYQWRRSDRITHNYYPIFINSINLLETTQEFDSILASNPYIEKSFEEQFIIGMKYDFTFDNSLSKRPHGFYFQAGISSSGNLLDLFKGASSDESERPYSFSGNIYSQFMKFTTDIRYYRNFREKSLAFRLYAGIGFPYSNSEVMPYVEQFYSGGSNSIRAFLARSLGPGNLPPPPDESDIIDQTGDIKLEGNFEYRFSLSKVLKGALFIDAGNIWLLNYDEKRPGAEFNFNTFYDQLAIGTGVGLRFDFDFFVLRTDFGFPVRTPYETDGSNWVRRVNPMVFNLAIGYPF
jgi:outer membrane protein insertion porin family